MSLHVATGLAKGAKALPVLASLAVEQALIKARIQQAHSVFLVLSSEFASQPQSAIRAAAVMAGTTQVFGCSATGLFTEEEWVLDCPAVAAMVFSEEVFSSTLSTLSPKKPSPLLTLAAPNAIRNSWLDDPVMRYGGVSGDATGQGPFSVWQHGKGSTQGYAELALSQGHAQILVSLGLKAVSPAQKIGALTGYDVFKIELSPALQHLKQAFQPFNDVVDGSLPYHRLMLAYAPTKITLEQGEFRLANIMAIDESNQTVTLSSTLKEGTWVRWMMRDPDTAQQEMQQQCMSASKDIKPAFGMLFSCLGRGPQFYGAQDQDLLTIKQQFQHLPLIGFYGNGEIAPLHGHNQLLQFATVLSLFTTA